MSLSRRFAFVVCVVFLFAERRLVGATVILQRGCRVETTETPECCSFPRRHKQTFATRIRVDAERDPDSLRQEKPGCGSGRSGELHGCPDSDLTDTDAILSCWMWRRVSVTCI